MSITRTSFYNSFGDLESVFKEALDLYRAEAPDAALALIAPDEPVVPAVRRMFRELCRVRTADREARGCLVVNSLADVQSFGKPTRAYLEAAVRDSTRAFEQVLIQAEAQKEIQKLPDRKATAAAFSAFLIGINNISKFVRSETELWRICESFLDRFGFGKTSRKRSPKSVSAFS